MNRYAKFIAIPQATHVKNNACFISDLKLITHFELGFDVRSQHGPTGAMKNCLMPLLECN